MALRDCDVATGDRWLRERFSDYRTWTRSQNSLLLVTFDESSSHGDGKRIVTLLDGAGVRPGRVDEPVDHYRLLATIESMYGLPALGHAADTTPITGDGRLITASRIRASPGPDPRRCRRVPVQAEAGG
jgi:phosphatidylinositol-3-phosphatase